MSEDIYKDIAQAYAAAAERAPGLKSRFAAAGFDPATVRSLADLSRLPVMKKEELLKLQRANPPFGGFLAADLRDVGRIYVSPGPIFEPSLSGGGRWPPRIFTWMAGRIRRGISNVASRWVRISTNWSSSTSS